MYTCIYIRVTKRVSQKYTRCSTLTSKRESTNRHGNTGTTIHTHLAEHRCLWKNQRQRHSAPPCVDKRKEKTKREERLKIKKAPNASTLCMILWARRAEIQNFLAHIDSCFASDETLCRGFYVTSLILCHIFDSMSHLWFCVTSLILCHIFDSVLHLWKEAKPRRSTSPLPPPAGVNSIQRVQRVETPHTHTATHRNTLQHTAPRK